MSAPLATRLPETIRVLLPSGWALLRQPDGGWAWVKTGDASRVVKLHSFRN